jgi:hypothetical protein
MEKFLVPPQQPGLAISESSEAWLTVELEGGLPRTRRDLFDPEPTVDVSWVLTISTYTYLTEFYRASAARDFEPFEIDLYVENGATLTTVEARFVPKSLKLTRQTGNTYFVSAQLVIVVDRIDDTWPPYVETVEELVTWILNDDSVATFEDSSEAGVSWQLA